MTTEQDKREAVEGKKPWSSPSRRAPSATSPLSDAVAAMVSTNLIARSLHNPEPDIEADLDHLQRIGFDIAGRANSTARDQLSLVAIKLGDEITKAVRRQAIKERAAALLDELPAFDGLTTPPRSVKSSHIPVVEAHEWLDAAVQRNAAYAELESRGEV